MMRALCVLGLALLVGCGGDNKTTGDAGNDGGSDGGGDAGGPTWGPRTTIDSAIGAGYELHAVNDPSGRPAVAYFVTNGACDYSLVLAREATDGTWTKELVPAAADGGTRLTGHYGAALAFAPDGTPAIQYLGGLGTTKDAVPDDRFRCQDAPVPAGGSPELPSDSVIAHKAAGGWTRETVAANSASIIPTGFAVDIQGGATGLWPALAIGATGVVHTAIRDSHYGADDSSSGKANLEYAQRTSLGGTQTVGQLIVPSTDESVSAGEHGPGSYTRMGLHANGQPFVSYSLSINQTSDVVGVWFASRATGAWKRQQLSAVQGIQGEGPSLAVSSAGLIAVAYQDSLGGDLLVASSADGVTFLADTVEALGVTGRHPAAAFAGETLGVLYGYCRDNVGPPGCDPNVLELRFRKQTATGWAPVESVGSLMPDSTALLGDAQGRYLAIWRDPAGGLYARRRAP